ncbi:MULTISPECIES: hypothetical protein [Okeania]|uniref:Uncharacterized protein n=1 Tax=Okeania hirsuta TaxID=1458930 RepID=A0A3N6RV13_9CYAN|nr:MULTISPECIES: hypothetical protein [Okeania]NEP06318.1 hypothetical protein [Okeania sp. SIO4D6]NEP43170.1 hypothetical protein [Okeania sp. SIO2H7]NES73040.1 hypothetical protein [Okeania sp. SIO2D1]NEP71550.1 hypothetical protein [Okeania sp. SIO2G5]NEP86876.1 hypothetical protein [Okeania sp. SIO2C2]
MLQINLLPGAINEIMASAAKSGFLTKLDCYGLMAAVLDDSLSTEDRSTVKRLSYFVLRGWVRVE